MAFRAPFCASSCAISRRWTEARRARAADYARAFAGTGIATPIERPQCRHVYHVYAVRLANRDATRAALQAAGIQTGVHYPIPVHLQPAHADLGYAAGDFPVSESVASQVLSLPMFPEMTSEQVQTVAAAVLAAEGVSAGAARPRLVHRHG